MANETIFRNGIKLGSSSVAVSQVLDEDNFASDSASALATQQSIKAYVDAQVGGLASALEFKGNWDASTAAYPASPTTGDTYVITVAGTISGEVLEVGDLIICKDGGTDAWTAVQKNLDGIVVGPASSTDNGLVLFNGTDGDVIKDSGVVISTDGTFAGNADTNIPTEKAVKTYVDTGLGTKQNTLTFGIADNNAVEIDDADAASGDYAKFTVNGLEGRSATEVKEDLALDNVTNDAQVKAVGSAVGDDTVVLFDGTTGDTVKSGSVTGTQLAEGIFRKATTVAGQYNINITGGKGVDLTAVLVDGTTSGTLIVKMIGVSNGSSVSYTIYETNGLGDITDLSAVTLTYEGDPDKIRFNVIGATHTWTGTIKYIVI